MQLSMYVTLGQRMNTNGNFPHVRSGSDRCCDTGLAAFPDLVAVLPDGRTLTTAAASASMAEPMETKVQTPAEIIARMQQAVPPGRQCLKDEELRQLATLTGALLASKPAAQEEYSRFLATAGKDIDLPYPVLAACLNGKRILVSGGTGCIGAVLMAQLAQFQPACLVSVSRGITQGWPRLADAEYVHADIRDTDQLAAVFGKVKCDIVFHVAGQRDPGLAEHEVHRTVTTNVLGTRNVISAAAATGVSHVVAASTGKAFRPYSSEIYTASKRAAEWLLCQAAADGLIACSAARFTHVIDNSIIHARLLDWCNGGVIRLHGADIAFYVQSALQSAQLLLAAAVGAQRGALRVHAINDLGWPVALVDVALGALARAGSGAPIYFSGHDRGYESAPFPALYDPMTAGDMSPLISAFEGAGTEQAWCQGIDVFSLRVASAPAPDERMAALAAACARTEQPEPVRTALDELSWALFDATMAAVPRRVLTRAVHRCDQWPGGLDAVHARMLATIRQYAAGAGLVPASRKQPREENFLPRWA
jgi:nucleoside-diphosphate-sugar epimerase